VDAVVLFSFVAGAFAGTVISFVFVIRPLMNQVLLMKREGFVSYPKIIKPPKSTSIEYRED